MKEFINPENIHFLWSVIALETLIILWLVISKIMNFIRNSIKNILFSFLISSGIVGGGMTQTNFWKKEPSKDVTVEKIEAKKEKSLKNKSS